jgi:hypothetical protein
MTLIERFTRDGASRYVWAVLALAAGIGLAYAVADGGRAVDDERAVAKDRAVTYVEEVLDPRLGGRDLSDPITGQQAGSLEALVGRAILADERIARVRIWSNDGTLLFSTDRSDRPGSNEGLNDPVLREASREGPITRSDFSDSGGADDPERSMFRTYVPLGANSVVEIDQTDEGSVGPIRSEWLTYQLLAGGLLLWFLVMLALSLRDPLERVNVGVPFAASSVPEGFALIDDDRLAAVQEVYRLASERVARLQEKLEESEEARRGLEGDIQRALSKAAYTASSPVAPAASAPDAPAAAPAPTAPEPAVVQVPESDVVVTAPLGDAWAAAPAGPLARATRAQKPAPTTSRKEKPVAEKPKRTPKRLKAKKPAAAPPEVAKPAPVQEPERRVAAVASTPAPPPTVVRPAASAPVEAPAPKPAAARPPDSAIDDAKAHAAALETFIRLTESDRQHHDTSTVDQGAIRAALARTAARKKPGGDRLQPHDEPQQESPGGPPRRAE